MRTFLKVAAFAALLGLWAVTAYAIAGPHPLPARIPTHFDFQGRPNGWGQPSTLWLLPFIATVIFGLMSLVARYPASFNYPVRVLPATRPRLESLALSMIAWIRLEVAALFLWIQYAIIASAWAGSNNLSPLLVPIVLVVVAATVGWHIRAIFVAGS